MRLQAVASAPFAGRSGTSEKVIPGGRHGQRERLLPGCAVGTVSFPFTDIEGSTRLWQAAPDAMCQGLDATMSPTAPPRRTEPLPVRAEIRVRMGLDTGEVEGTISVLR